MGPFSLLKQNTRRPPSTTDSVAAVSADSTVTAHAAVTRSPPPPVDAFHLNEYHVQVTIINNYYCFFFCNCYQRTRNMSTIRENIPIRFARKMNIVKVATSQKDEELENKRPTEDNLDDGQLPSMSSEKEVNNQIQKNGMYTVKTHCRSDGSQYITFLPRPSPPNVLPLTLKCDPSPNLSRTIVVDAANEVGQQSSDDSEQDVVGAQSQLMQPVQKQIKQEQQIQREEQIQREQPQSTDVPPKVGWYPGEAAKEDNEPKFNGCCDACFYYTIKCCDIFGMI